MSTFDYIKQSLPDGTHTIRLDNHPEFFEIGVSELSTVLNNPNRHFFTPFIKVIHNKDMWKVVQNNLIYYPDTYKIVVVIREMEKHQGAEHVAHREITQVYTFDEISIADMKTTISLVLGFKNNGSTIH